MKCFLDMDGVLCDFIGGAVERHGLPDPYLDPKSFGNFETGELWGMSNTQFWEPLKGADFWANLAWMPDGKQILKLVESRFGEENVCLLTAPSNDRDCVAGKHDWVVKHVPNYRKRFVPTSAKEFLAHEKAWLIDDRDENLIKFGRNGGNVVLVPRLWNTGHPIKNVMEWLEHRLPQRKV